MKTILFALLIFVSVPAKGQHRLPGSINMPPMLEIDVDQLNMQGFNFGAISDYSAAKIISGCYKLSIAANAPWLVSVRTSSPHFHKLSPQGAENIPVSLIGIKKSNSAAFTQLSQVPQTLIRSENSNVHNNYLLDVSMAPPMDYEGGHYSVHILFYATLQ
jgi:hypothetical protein